MTTMEENHITFIWKITTILFHNSIGILVGIALNLQIALGTMVIWTILILLIQEQGIGMCFHLFCVIFSLFHPVCIVSKYRSFTNFGRVIPRCFILFDVMINVIVYLISLSVSLPLVYSIATYFCMLISHISVY